MVSWYYVDGTERMGPVGVDVLETLYKDQKIGPETYVWKKGFANWERMKNVSELSFENSYEEESLSTVDASDNLSTEETTAIFNELSDLSENEQPKNETIKTIEPFDWGRFNHKEIRFFVKAGKDRHQPHDSIWGPYSAEQLLEAFKQKRLNEKSLIFTHGVSDWQAIEAIPFFKQELGFVGLSLPIATLKPVYFIYKDRNDIIPLMIQTINKHKAVIHTGYNLIEDTSIEVSLFKGAELVQTNVLMTIESKNKFVQTVTVILDYLVNDTLEVIQEFNG